MTSNTDLASQITIVQEHGMIEVGMDRCHKCLTVNNGISKQRRYVTKFSRLPVVFKQWPVAAD